MSGRCAYEFDIEAWEEEHDRRCMLSSDEEIVEDGVWRCPHEVVAGHEECIFHLAPEERPEDTDASEAFVAAVEGNAPNEFVGAVFPEFDLSGQELDDEEAVDLRYTQVGDLEWSDATVGVDVDASGASFGEDVSDRNQTLVNQSSFHNANISVLKLRRAAFHRGASFSSTDFRSVIDFLGVKFDEETRFTGAVFHGKGDFGEAEFSATAAFRVAEFKADVHFYGTKFCAGADFYSAEFRTKVDLRSAEFRNNASFHHAKFGSNADFNGSEFDARVDFRDTTFKQNANFWGTTFGSESTFKGMKVKGLTNLSRTDLQQANFRDADLSNANFEDADLTRAALYGTDLTNAKLYGARLTDARISDATDFGIRGRGTLLPGVSPSPEVAYDPRSEPMPDDDGDVNNYTRAAAVYSELESLAEDNAASNLARKCFAWRKDMQRLRYYSDDGDANDRDPLAGLRASLSNGLMRYGESPYRLLGWAGLLVFVCGLLYHAFDLLVPTPQATTDAPTSLLDALYFSTLTFTTLGMGDYRPANELGRALAIFETSAGVILLALLVFVFGRRATR